MAFMTSALTRMHRCHPCSLTLVVMRKGDGMFLFYGNEFCYWLIKDFAAWTIRKHGINLRSWDHDWNVCWTLWSSLLRHTRLGISLEVWRVVWRLISVLKLGLGSVDLRGMMSVFLQLERSEPTTWKVTSAQVQKHSLSTMLSKQADNDLFSNSKALALNSEHSIHSFSTLISARCLLMWQKNLSLSRSFDMTFARLFLLFC